MDSLKVSIGVPSQPSTFTFVPQVLRLPVENIFSEEERSAARQNSARGSASMSDGEIFKAEKVFIRDFVEGGAGNVTQPVTKHQLPASSGHVSLPQAAASPSVSARSENTPEHVAARTASMETAVNKHGGFSQRQYHDTSGFAGNSSGFFANRASASEDRTSPTWSADLFPTPASSRESVLSEDSDKDKSWSAAALSSVTSPASFSRSVSPCSSVRSGLFSPAVVHVRKHFLAPGSSLAHTPQTCFSSCESLSSSVCSQPPRHRPPLTRLSLLTAILRKGRLPVLSPALQRPYTPCWPVNPVTLSFCNACSAASSVASIPLEFSSQFSSTASIDSQSHVHREPSRCVTAPPPVQADEFGRAGPVRTQAQRCSEQIRSNSAPRWEQVVSPPPVRSALPRAPLPLFSSDFRSVSLPKNEKTDCATPKTLQAAHVSVLRRPELKPSGAHTSQHKWHEDDSLKKVAPPSPKLNSEPRTAVQHKPMHNSSLSRLHSLSQQLRSPPARPPQLQPCLSRSPASPVAPAGGGESMSSRPASTTSATTSQGFHKAHCLSPSRYTPLVFPGWPSPSGSPTPTPSPAPPGRDFAASPALSLRSTPSPRPGSGISDCGDREGKKRKTHKIKLSYKSLAAIPTNTLLLDQQAIDEQVERGESPCEAPDRGGEDPHAEMRSPAELRQQSEELYAVIDEILANSIPASKTSRTLPPSRSPAANAGLQQTNSSFPRSLGRETKYASLGSLQPSSSAERNLMDPKKTKPGVIRPMTAIPRLAAEDEEEFRPNPFRQIVGTTFTDSKKMDNQSLEERGKDFYRSSKGQTWREEERKAGRSLFSACDLQITEPADRISLPVKEATMSFSPTEGRMGAFQAHI